SRSAPPGAGTLFLPAWRRWPLPVPPDAETGPAHPHRRPDGRPRNCSRTRLFHRPPRCRWRPPAAAPHKPRVSLNLADQGRGGAVILHIVQAEAPDDVVVGLGHVKLGIAILIVAMALAAIGFAAAIAIGDQIGLVVIGIDAGADPGGGGRGRARRTGVRAAAATGAEIAVHAAIAP